MPKALKVYRTSAGFHDAYVATPSKAAALRAWGSERDLFVWGAAEEVTDPVLMKGALAAPGTVIKRLRGSDAEQIAALDADKAHPKPGQRATATKSKSKPRPRPRRDRLDKAEAALSAAEVRQSDERAELDAREGALRDERRRLEARQHREIRRVQAARDRAGEMYETAIRDWQG